MATATFTRITRAPSLAVLPDPEIRLAIASSFLFHVASLCALPLVLMLLPKPAAPSHDSVQMVSLRTQEPLALNFFPRISRSGSSGFSGSSSPTSSGAKARGRSKSSSGKKSAQRNAETVYAGLQEIHSELPHPTNRVQSILRPDLVNPPKLRFPVRLPSMVVVPAPASPVLAARPLKEDAETPPPPVPVIASELSEHPAIPVPASPPHMPGSEQEPSSKQPEAQPAPAALPDPTASNAKTALVINAVEVPKGEVAIPDAEIAGSFSVVPSKNGGEDLSGTSGGSNVATGAETEAPAGASGDGKTGSAGTDKDGPSHGGSGSATARREGGGSGGQRSGSGDHAGGGGVGTASGPRGGTGTTPGSGSGNFPGISILGGTGGGSRSSRASRSRPGYELTIVSGGSSGGAGRDFGVFGRDETVYTVYITMSDAGGGGDWSMQYAVVGDSPSGNGLLTPPVASKKLPATIERGDSGHSDSPIFVRGIISEDGTLHELRAIRKYDDTSRVALEALAGWVFLPAQINEKPVATKVLIGVVPIRRKP